MNVKRSLAALTAAVAVLAGATGCSSNTSSGVIDTKADKGLAVLGDHVTYDPNHLVNDGQPIELGYWSWGDASTDPVITMLHKYEKIHPNVTFKISQVAWSDYWVKTPLSLKGNKNAPVLFNVHNSQDALLRPHMAAYDIDLKDLEADYTNVETHVVDGKVDYIDSVINTGNIYYNKTLWKQAGLTDDDIPTTWDEFAEVARKLTKFDGGKMVQAGFNMNGDGRYDGLWQGLNYQRGTLMFDKSGTKANYDSKATRENLRFLLDLYEKDKVGSVKFGDNSEQSFGNGQTAMIYAWGALQGTLETKYPDIDYGVFPTPTFTKAVPFAYDRYNGESTPGINVHQSDEQQAVAQDFIRFMLAGDDYVRTAVKLQNSFPGKKSLQNDPEILANPVMAAIKPRLDRLIWPGPTPSTLESSPKIAFQNVFQNHQNIAKAVAAAQAQIETDMKGSDFTSLERMYRHYDEAKQD
ncbi:extracellular solute-binding protein [Bifidobacterium sp. MA2]|uniref:Extracellular solute-binding protein n=1 Tax=Bifidobacterium santillanense TaxID=2809028 RepID=A0ABS5UMM8_9BIFI|nr:extracellular solute-binding protein [Bifidobacterium santillanense]MBT1172173.1 extracellular solute-binding protein [Bifidobacterium santillanense]